MLAVITIPVQAVTTAVTTNDISLDGLFFLLNSHVRLGDLKTDPVNPTLEYFEANEALSFFLLTLNSKWQLFLSGDDFVSGGDRIPLEQMEWKLGTGNYRKMPRAGKEELIMTHGQSSSGWLHYDNLSFRLVLQGDEAPGRYNSTLTLTMVNL
jgi:hypothetical protein